MITSTQRRRRFVLISVLFATICLFGVFGCSTRQPTQADYQRIENNPHLSAQQKNDAINALSPDPDAQYYNISIIVALIGVALLVGALAAKKKIDGLAHAAIDRTIAGSTGGSKSTVHKSSPSANTPKPKASAGPPASYLQQIQEQKKEQEPPVNKLPETKAEVAAIPLDKRSFSFFSSRPLPIDVLQKLTIQIGYRQITVLATEQEAERYQAGNAPRVRAFTIKGKTIPWYEWQRYDPYKHYRPMEDSGWSGTHEVIPCLLRVENLDPSLTGYRSRELRDLA